LTEVLDLMMRTLLNEAFPQPEDGHITRGAVAP
jgi:hypothetical protein